MRKGQTECRSRRTKNHLNQPPPPTLILYDQSVTKPSSQTSSTTLREGFGIFVWSDGKHFYGYWKASASGAANGGYGGAAYDMNRFRRFHAILLQSTWGTMMQLYKGPRPQSRQGSNMEMVPGT